MRYFYLILSVIIPVGGCSMITHLWADPLRIDIRVLVSLTIFFSTVTVWADCCRKAIQAASKDYSESSREDKG